MEQAFNTGLLRARAERLSHRGRLAFVLSCAERLAPNYVAFSRHHKWGDIGALSEALDMGWRYLRGETVDAAALCEGLARCEAAEPDTEDFDSEFVSAGLDAANCCELVLQLVKKDEVEPAVEAASLARDTVDMHIQELESLRPQDPDLETRILEHPLMQRELRRQREDLELLERMPLSDDVVEWIGQLWRTPKASNIDRPA
ncbi:DUF416 family protein [Sorangium sp. So ce1128]